ncbi:MAG: hypothetical protein KBT14_00060 [Proteobacteria bacterium]|nr:hypothetical protein [Candidatus Enterousia onthequi]
MNNIDETGMPTDAYITVRRNEQGEVDIYVGGKPATTYYGQDILNIPFIKEVFAWMQEQNPYIKEFHVGAFATRGYKKGKTGNPSSGLGPNSWCRLKFTNKKYGTWVFNRTYGSRDAYDWTSHCASCCATSCAYAVRKRAGFRTAVFNAPIAKTVENPTVEINGGGLAQLIVNSVYGKQK